MEQLPLLTIIIVLPLVGGLLALATSRRPMACRWISLVFSLVDLSLVSSLFFMGLTPKTGPTGAWLMAEDLPWIESFNIRYSLGLDGVSLPLILLTAFLLVICVLISWKQIDQKVGEFHFCLMLTQTSIMGVFLATDLFLFYLFWEMQLIPMFFLVGIWGHEKRIQATIKFIMFSVSGSLFMLIALIGLYLLHGAHTGHYTFALSRLMDASLSHGEELFLYAAFFVAFAIKVPVIPVHTWLPDAHTQAPTAGSVDLAGLLLKTGPYALFRIAIPIFPTAVKTSIPLLFILGLGGLFYAAWIAFSQHDVKRLVAYSSIAHMGLIVIGFAVWDAMTLNGAFLLMINHALSTSALFIMVGMLNERLDSRDLAHIGGLWKKMPVYSAFFLFFALASAGLPGLNNFVSELLIVIGTFKYNPLVAILAFAGLVFTLAYILRMVQHALFGVTIHEDRLFDATPREVIILGVLASAILFLGLHPAPVLDLFREPVRCALENCPF